MLPEVFDDLVQCIYAGVCDDEAFLAVLRIIAERHQCGSAVFIYTDRALPHTDISMSYGPFSRPEVQARYFAGYADEDPAPAAMARMPVGQAVATDKLFTPEERARSRMLQEFLRPIGLEEALGGPVTNGEGRTGIVAIHRGPDRPSFRSDEIATFGRLLPHFGQALRLRRTIFAANDAKDALAAALEPASQAVIVLDRQASVMHANARARALFARNDGLIITRTGRMKIRDEQADGQLRLALASLPPSFIFRARRINRIRPYVMRVSPAGAGMTSARRDGVVLYVFDPDHQHTDAPGIFKAALGVSKEAAMLLSALVSGGDLASYAGAAGVSRHTARFHLRALFAATGLSRQADLTSLATGLLHELGETRQSPAHLPEIGSIPAAVTSRRGRHRDQTDA